MKCGLILTRRERASFQFNKLSEMEKKPSFIDRLKARFFKQSTQPERQSSILGSIKQKRVRLEAIDHSVSNKKIMDLVNG